MNSNGFTLLWRKVFENPLFNLESALTSREGNAILLRFYVWQKLISIACWKDTHKIFMGKEIILKPGQILITSRTLINVGFVSHNTIRKILRLFQDVNMVTIEKHNAGQIISITKWSEYQCEINSSRPVADQLVTGLRPVADQQPQNPFNTRSSKEREVSISIKKEEEENNKNTYPLAPEIGGMVSVVQNSNPSQSKKPPERKKLITRKIITDEYFEFWSSTYSSNLSRKPILTEKERKSLERIKTYADLEQFKIAVTNLFNHEYFTQRTLHLLDTKFEVFFSQQKIETDRKIQIENVGKDSNYSKYNKK